MPSFISADLAEGTATAPDISFAFVVMVADVPYDKRW
jgi:hypothetical protein